MADQLYEDLTADSPLGFVRALIPDIVKLEDPVDPTREESYLFDDNTLLRYLALNRNHPKRAAASACIALAGNDNLILKKITTEDLATDGPAVAKEHRLRAIDLRKEADDDDKADEPSVGVFTAPLRSHYRYDAERIMHRGSRWGF